EPANPSDVAPRPIDTGDKAAFDRVVAAREDNRDCTGRLHGDERRIVAAGCGDHSHLTSNEISHERRQPIQSSLRPAIIDRDVLTLDVTGLVQAAAETGHPGSERLRRLSTQESDHRHRRLLCAHHERPRSRRAAEQGDELAPLHLRGHSITSSARASTFDGTVIPSALAVVRLITSSNLVGCSTGMSPGFVPRRILSTKSAVRRNRAGKLAPYDMRAPNE